jgi:hypothetical protein
MLVLKLLLTRSRFVAAGTTLWDGGAVDKYLYELPATDEDVRRDINALLAKHEQRELPPIKEKKTPAKKKTKAIKEES